MEDHVYKIIEITGTSEKSGDDAVQKAVTRAASSIQNLRWFEVVETRGSITNGSIGKWQVTVKLGFTMK